MHTNSLYPTFPGSYFQECLYADISDNFETFSRELSAEQWENEENDARIAGQIGRTGEEAWSQEDWSLDGSSRASIDLGVRGPKLRCSAEIFIGTRYRKMDGLEH